MDPLYASADREGAHWSAEGVTTAKGFKAAYRQYIEGGWTQLRAAPAFGGQGMPALLVSAVEEIFASANLAFRMCPMLTQGATEAIAHAGSQAQKDLYLPRMVRGEWAGYLFCGHGAWSSWLLRFHHMYIFPWGSRTGLA